MKLSKFKFNLPSELIALHPAKNRDESRLMVVHRDTGEIEHREFKDILDYYGKGDVFIFNNTKVFPARLYGNKEKTGARIEVFLLRELNEDLPYVCGTYWWIRLVRSVSVISYTLARMIPWSRR